MNGIILFNVTMLVISILCAYELYNEKRGNFKIFSIAFIVGAIGELCLILISLNNINNG